MLWGVRLMHNQPEDASMELDMKQLFQQGTRQNYRELYEYMKERLAAERRARIAVEQELSWTQNELLRLKAGVR